MSEHASQVIVNGETVVFEGPPPSTVQEAVGLVDGALNQQGQIIEVCVIDGKPLVDDPALLQKPYQIVEISARPWDKVCADAVREACAEVRQAMREASTFGASMLIVPLGQVLKEIDQLAEKLRIILEPLEIAQRYARTFKAAWMDDVLKINGSITEACEEFSSALERQDVGRAADILCIVLPKYLIAFTHMPQTPWSGVEL